MREREEKGAVSVRIGFATEYGRIRKDGTGSRVAPHIEIRDETSGKVIDIKLTAVQFTEMLAGSEARIAPDAVAGFGALPEWGKFMKHTDVRVPIQHRDYMSSKSDTDPRVLPHVDEACARLEADGWQVDTPRRNNGGQWVIVGRRYDDEP
jgi:hypothetical protein